MCKQQCVTLRVYTWKRGAKYKLITRWVVVKTEQTAERPKAHKVRRKEKNSASCARRKKEHTVNPDIVSKGSPTASLATRPLHIRSVRDKAIRMLRKLRRIMNQSSLFLQQQRQQQKNTNVLAQQDFISLIRWKSVCGVISAGCHRLAKHGLPYLV